MIRVSPYVLMLLMLSAIVWLCAWHLRPGPPSSPFSVQVLEQPAPSSPNSNNSIGLPRHGIGGLSVPEIKTRLEAFQDVSDIDQKPGFAALLRRWVELDERGAFEFANSLEDSALRRQALVVVGDALSHSDPQFLAHCTLVMTSGDARTLLVHELANIWSEADVQNALAWGERLPESPDKEDALVTIRRQLARQNPQAASALVASLPESDSTSSLVATVAEHWASSNPINAVEWAATLPDAERTLAISKSVGVWAQHDPKAAAEFVAQMPTGDMQDESVRSVVSSWAPQNPPAAAAWIINFPGGDLQDHCIKVAVTDWTMADPGRAYDWVSSLPDAAMQSIAYKSLAESIMYSLSEPLAQEQSMEAIMRSWSQNDPAAAKSWLAGWNANQDLKTRVQSSLAPD